MNRLALGTFWMAVVVLASATVGCKKSGGAAGGDGSAADGGTEPAPVACAPVDGGPAGEDAATVAGTDEFGPNAPAVKPPSSLGRLNVFEVTTPALLERVDIHLRGELPHTRLTIAVHEATSRTTAFTKLTDVQLDMDICEGWVTSGPLSVPLKVGRFYAVGFDPNQVVTPFVSTDGDSLPIDGMFGRLLGSRTATSVSVPSLTWEKFVDKEYNRQRIVTSPRAPDPVPDGGSTDGGTNQGAGGGAGGGAGVDAGRG